MLCYFQANHMICNFPGKPYESQLSSYHQVYVSPLCEVRTELISLRRGGFSTVIIAIILAVITSLLLLLSIAVCCRRKGQRYELVNVLSPGKCLQVTHPKPDRTKSKPFFSPSPLACCLLHEVGQANLSRTFLLSYFPNMSRYPLENLAVH